MNDLKYENKHLIHPYYRMVVPRVSKDGVILKGFGEFGVYMMSPENLPTRQTGE